MPFTITERHILAADALPMSVEKNRAPAKPSSFACGRNASACGPPSSMDVAMRLGGTGLITAAST